jgi:hypothetical protein
MRNSSLLFIDLYRLIVTCSCESSDPELGDDMPNTQTENVDSGTYPSILLKEGIVEGALSFRYDLSLIVELFQQSQQVRFVL